MYDKSRDLYTSLTPLLWADGSDPARSRRLLLRACENAVQVLAQRPEAPHAAARRLFADVRTMVAPAHQLAALRLIEERLESLGGVFAAQAGPSDGPGMCIGTNRRGEPCRRPALPGSRHCPSHRPAEVGGAPRRERRPRAVSGSS